MRAKDYATGSGLFRAFQDGGFRVSLENVSVRLQTCGTQSL
jgi:hypothetical protein